MSEERSDYQVMSEERLAAIEARDQARTQGEWRAVQKGNTVKSHAIEGICSGISPKTGNAAFIAACSIDVSDLLAEVRRLRQQEASLSQCRRELLILLAWYGQRTHDLREPLRALGLPSDIDGRTAFIRWLNAAADEGKRIIEEAQKTGEG